METPYSTAREGNLDGRSTAIHGSVARINSKVESAAVALKKSPAEIYEAINFDPHDFENDLLAKPDIFTHKTFTQDVAHLKYCEDVMAEKLSEYIDGALASPLLNHPTLYNGEDGPGIFSFEGAREGDSPGSAKPPTDEDVRRGWEDVRRGQEEILKGIRSSKSQAHQPTTPSSSRLVRFISQLKSQSSSALSSLKKHGQPFLKKYWPHLTATVGGVIVVGIIIHGIGALDEYNHPGPTVSNIKTYEINNSHFALEAQAKDYQWHQFPPDNIVSGRYEIWGLNKTVIAKGDMNAADDHFDSPNETLIANISGIDLNDVYRACVYATARGKEKWDCMFSPTNVSQEEAGRGGNHPPSVENLDAQYYSENETLVAKAHIYDPDSEDRISKITYEINNTGVRGNITPTKDVFQPISLKGLPNDAWYKLVLRAFDNRSTEGNNTSRPFLKSAPTTTVFDGEFEGVQAALTTTKIFSGENAMYGVNDSTEAGVLAKTNALVEMINDLVKTNKSILSKDQKNGSADFIDFENASVGKITFKDNTPYHTITPEKTFKVRSNDARVNLSEIEEFMKYVKIGNNFSVADLEINGAPVSVINNYDFVNCGREVCEKTFDRNIWAEVRNQGKGAILYVDADRSNQMFTKRIDNESALKNESIKNAILSVMLEKEPVTGSNPNESITNVTSVDPNKVFLHKLESAVLEVNKTNESLKNRTPLDVHRTLFIDQNGNGAINKLIDNVKAVDNRSNNINGSVAKVMQALGLLNKSAISTDESGNGDEMIVQGFETSLGRFFMVYNEKDSKRIGSIKQRSWDANAIDVGDTTVYGGGWSSAPQGGGSAPAPTPTPPAGGGGGEDGGQPGGQ